MPERQFSLMVLVHDLPLPCAVLFGPIGAGSLAAVPHPARRAYLPGHVLAPYTQASGLFFGSLLVPTVAANDLSNWLYSRAC